MLGLPKRMITSILRVPPEPADPRGAPGSLRVFPVSPRYFHYRLVLWSFRQMIAFLGLVAGLAFFCAMEVGAAPSAFALLLPIATCALGLFSFCVHALFSFIVLRLDYELRWYKVTDRSLRIREGVLSVKEFTMTFANIQDISITQGPLQRLLRIADLKVESAGGGGGVHGAENADAPTTEHHTAYFRGVDNPEEIRDFMRERLKSYNDQGLGGGPEELLARRAHHLPAATDAISTEALPLLTAIKQELVLFRRAMERACGS